MLTQILVMAALGALPVSRFIAEHPLSERLSSADGATLVHASGFLADTGAARPEDAARAFLARHGAAFGLDAGQALVPRHALPPGRAGAVRLARTIAGLPVFGGDLVVGVDAMNLVFQVNTSGAGPASGRHLIGEGAAHAYAVTSIPGGFHGDGPATVAAGWKTLAGTTRAVYRVDFVAEEPAGDWRTYVDGETGQVLFREDLRAYATAPGSVYQVSPVETQSAACPIQGGVHTLCASPVTVTLPNLDSAASLTGSQVSVFNCKGGNAPTAPATVLTACSPVASDAGGFVFPADTTFALATDDFAAAMAYYQLDRHVSFFRALDPALPPPGGGRALSASVPALVNVKAGGVAFDNAFYSGALDAMVFGQGQNLDYAYDATIAYHEFTHGVVSAWGGYHPDLDALGGLDEPGAVNEGTADAMAVSETGRSEVASFAGAQLSNSLALRDMNDPNATRSCQGNGTVANTLGAPSVNGVDGEVHDDGEIWNGLYWEVYQGLKAAGIKGCGGACEAGPALQYQTLQLAAGTSPTLQSYAASFKSAATALFPGRPEVAAYVDCVARRRGFDRCDRTVPVYAGETKVQFMRLGYSAFQMAVDVTDAGTASLDVCSGQGTATTIWLRKDQPVALTPGSGTRAASILFDDTGTFTQLCSNGPTNLTGFKSPGRWYILLDSPSAFLGSAPGFDVYKVTLSATGFAARPAATTPPTCVVAGSVPPPTISPTAPTVAAVGPLTFTASGGSGTGYTFALVTNASGGSITTAGAYTAGATGSVTDVVRVTDSAGGTASASVTVTAVQTPPPTISPAAPSVAAGGHLAFTASGGSGTGYTWALAVNASGGSITTAGAYTAGTTGAVTDTVRVTDSAGSNATVDVTVTASIPTGSGGGGGGKGGCGSTGAAELSPLALLLGSLWRRRRSRAVAGTAR